MFSTFSVLTLASVAVAAPMSLNTLFSTTQNSTITPNTTQVNNASWYMQNGNAGACGLYSTDLDLVVGLPLEFYNETSTISKYCGTYIVVTNIINNLTVTARVADASATESLLSMSVASWRSIKADETKMTNVTWIFANSTQIAAAVAALPINNPAPFTSSYVAPSSTYTKPSSTFVKPSSTSTYVKPTSVYVKPSSTYIAPSSTYTPSSIYKAPSSTFTPKTSTYSAPSSTYTPPSSTYTPPTSTYTPPKVTQAPSSGQYSGDATYFYQNGNPGACGNYNQDSAYIVALGTGTWSGGSKCGQQVRITRGDKSITATVADLCPTCNTGTSLDLSVAAFNALASPSEGLFKMTWSFV